MTEKEKKKQALDLMKGTIVTFNVGGQIYSVAKDLVQKFPNTMLCMAASEVVTSNEDDPIFIDRNGHQFQYVLDFMRDGDTLSLPTHTRKEVLYKDLC
jgi:BTB/POZ domain